MGELRTERLVLTPLTAEDAPSAFRLHADARTWSHFPMGRWTDPRQGDRFVEMSRASFERTGIGQYAVREPGTGHVIGSVGVFAMSGPREGPMQPVLAPTPADQPLMPTRAILNIGWRMDPDRWGRGLATEAARACADQACALWPDLPMTACVLSTNPASAAVCRHLGLSLLWSGESGEALRVRLHRPPIPGGRACVRWFFADREVDLGLIRARVRGL